jgi:hypothetical protein
VIKYFSHSGKSTLAAAEKVVEEEEGEKISRFGVINWS